MGTEIYDYIVHLCQFFWHDQEQQAVLDESVTNGETYGCIPEKAIFNPELEGGLGEVEIISVDPFHFGWYPVKSKFKKAQAVLHFYPMPTLEARQKWPKFAKKIKSDQEILKELGDERREIVGGRPGEAKGWFTTIQNVVKQMGGNTEGEAGTEGQETLVVEAWVKDRTMVQETEVDLDTGMEFETGFEIPKYAGFIRQITTCNGGEIVLSDLDNPSINHDIPRELTRHCYLYDKAPFSFTQSITDTSNAWGMADMEQLEGIQVEVNKTISQFNIFKDRAARLKIINPKGSGVSNQQLDNYPGVIRPSNPLMAQSIRYLDPPKLPVDLKVAFDLFKELFFLVAGTFELELAQTPGREVVAYKAIAALLERATTMMKGKVRNYSKMIRERGRMYLSLAQNFYTIPREIPYEKQGEELSFQFTGPDMIFPARLTVVSGSTMPVSRVQQREEAIGLAKDGHIDTQELLKKLDWDDYRTVVKRMQQGPLSALVDRFKQMGAPDPLLQAIQEFTAMEPKDFEKLVVQNRLPSFQEILDPQQQESMEDAEKQMEIVGKQADIGKTEADRQLVMAKIQTEMVKQYVQMFGTELDDENMELKRIELAAQIREGMEKGQSAMIKATADLVKAHEQRGQGPYAEHGLKSNNQP